MHPVLFQIGSMEVRSYFVAVCLAFFIAAWMAARRAAVLGLTRGQIAVLGSVALVVGVAGARLGSSDGGLGFYAGAALGLPAVAWVLRLYGKAGRRQD